MDSLDLNLVLAHWPLVSAFGVFYVIGRAMKSGPLSSERARSVGFVRFVRRWLPLPLHPIAAGVLLGLVPGVPVSLGEDYPFGPSLYYAAAGALSVVWHDLYSEWKKFKD